MGCCFLLQGIFPTQGLNSGHPHCRQTLYRLSHKGSPLLPRRRRQRTEPWPPLLRDSGSITLPSLGFSFLIHQVSISDHLSAKSKGLEGESERAFEVTGCHRAREERREQKRIKNSGLGGLELESQLWGQPSASVSPSV